MVVVMLSVYSDVAAVTWISTQTPWAHREHDLVRSRPIKSCGSAALSHFHSSHGNHVSSRSGLCLRPAVPSAAARSAQRHQNRGRVRSSGALLSCQPRGCLQVCIPQLSASPCPSMWC
jgi:hypothetical protein